MTSKKKSNILYLYEYGDKVTLPDDIEPEALKYYLQKVWQNRYWIYKYTEEVLEENFDGQPFLQFDGRSIRACNYAGVISFQSLTIVLIPKLFKETAFSTQTLAHLPFYLSYCRHIHFPFQWIESDNAILDILTQWIHFFANFTRNLLQEQPYLTYQTYTGQTDFLRGKLAVQHYINEQIAKGLWQQMQTEQQPFVINNLFNQIVKYTVSLLFPYAKGETYGALQGILHLLEDVELRGCTTSDCDSVHLNRLYPEHQKVIDMCRFFLIGDIGTYRQHQPVNIAFLVPMERVFEDFVAGFVQTHFPQWQVIVQKHFTWATSSKQRNLLVKPDIWLPLHQTVWDTKYKIQPAQGDLYQMHAYATALGVRKVHLLYASDKEVSLENIDLQSGSDTITIYIHYLPIVLLTTNDTFSDLTLRLKETLQKIADK
ncbi:hypothetical protein QNI19_35205 [Cytophagaceae bacterium DM2B3-1]|uniref:Restriction endonuclease n=1 Tax=Xanthocytophaga flava TaxID=3048013 RepID=A0ABT7CWX3_9BACT|nr:hypothetical protein [Xanthocytophaga flavus]MDJ1498237.1 hypothetical protein [Xanthocytophaga flavus]